MENNRDLIAILSIINFALIVSLTFVVFDINSTVNTLKSKAWEGAK